MKYIKRISIKVFSLNLKRDKYNGKFKTSSTEKVSDSAQEERYYNIFTLRILCPLWGRQGKLNTELLNAGITFFLLLFGDVKKQPRQWANTIAWHHCHSTHQATPTTRTMESKAFLWTIFSRRVSESSTTKVLKPASGRPQSDAVILGSSVTESK